MTADRLPPAYSLPQVIERLPLHARQKHEQLTAALADSEALVRSLMERIKATEDRLADISRRYEYSHDSGLVAELDAARASLERLDRERSRRNSIRANAEQTLSRLNNFLMAKASGAADIAAPPKLNPAAVAGRRKGESVRDALSRVRREIAAAQGELRRIRTAPPTTDEIKIAVLEEVDRLGRQGRPLVTTEGGKVTINWPDVQMYASPGAALSAPSGSMSKMLAAVFPTELKKLLIAGIEDVEGGIPTIERPRLIREAEANLYALEVAEEKLVMAALEQGLEVHRRVDASPWVILGYGVVEEAAPEAAA